MNARLTLLIICLSNVCLQLYGQGLKIQGNDFFIDNRSSYTVFDGTPPIFENRLALDFEIAPMNIREAFSIGYILRIKNEEANTTYNIMYNDQGGRTVFKLNHEGRDVLIVASLDKEKLYENQWIKMHLEFDLLKDSVTFRINEEEFRAGGLRLKNQWRPHIHFGRSEHVIDVPTFNLRNLSVGNNEKMYSFPLNENEGNAVHDSRKKVMGYVQNPVWLINDAYYWKTADVTFASGTVAGPNINTDTQEVYYFNKDSIIFYNVRTQDTYSRKYINDCPLYLRLGTNFIDKQNKRLYVYEVSDLLGGDVTMAYLDLETFAWVTVSKQLLPIQLHHHSSFYDEANRRYIIFGGFGNLKYNKNFYSFNLDTNVWETLEFGGDKITPRYFTSLGCSEDANILYLFGGMGNESGDQSVGRVYYYELYKVDLKEKWITKLWEIPWRKENMVPVRGMVMTDDESVYALCYPEHFSTSFLKLYRFSIEDGSYEIFGDSIPIVSEKITTNANLYYNKRTNEFYSIVQEFDYDDTASSAKIYSLSYPPVTMEGLLFYAKAKSKNGIWLLLLLPVGIGIGIFFYLVKKAGKEKKSNDSKIDSVVDDKLHHSPPTIDLDQKERGNALYLFGNFSIRDRKNRDISYMLSTKLKQAFFLILQYSLKHGITTQELSELLWPDKPEDKVKNSRGVTINNLRKVLNELDGIKLIHEKGSYKILFEDDCYCDYVKCLDIIGAADTNEHIEDFIQIISRGKFLQSEDIFLLDSFKEYIERKLEPVLLIEVEKHYNANGHHIVIALCDALFHIDPLNEEALHYIVKSYMKLRMHDEAKRKYMFFVTEYKNTMDADYPKAFTDLKG